MTSSSPSPTILLVGSQLRQSLALESRFPIVTVDPPRVLDVARKSPPDLIIAPASSPVFDGVAACVELKGDPELSHTLVLLVDSTGRPSEIVRALEAGADDCVDASIDREVLAARVAALLRRRAAESKQLAVTSELEERASHLEAELRSVHRNANQVEAIGRLAGGVAHNFNNLLTIILVSAELLMNDLDEGSPHWLHSREIYEAANRAAGLTNQLLAFSRRQMLRPANVDLNETLVDLTTVLRDTLGGQIDLRISLEPGLPPVYVDPSQFRRVVLDLAIHARNEMPHGGTVVVETSRVALTESYVADKVVVQPGKYVLLAISDTGPGMDVDTQLRLFEPFFSAKGSNHGGSDLGLSTVYGIVKQSGGYIWVYSERGQGTTFKIYLPEASPSRARPSIPSGHQQLPRGQASVLVVDDEPGLRAVASRVLESCGYLVFTAGSGEQALGRCLNDGLEPDLLITDVVMPGINGNQLVARLRAHRADLRVLFTSGFSAEAALLHGVAPGEHFLSKPFTPSDLAHKVREVLGGVAAR